LEGKEICVIRSRRGMREKGKNVKREGDDKGD